MRKTENEGYCRCKCPLCTVFCECVLYTVRVYDAEGLDTDSAGASASTSAGGVVEDRRKRVWVQSPKSDEHICSESVPCFFRLFIPFAHHHHVHSRSHPLSPPPHCQLAIAISDLLCQQPSKTYTTSSIKKVGH